MREWRYNSIFLDLGSTCMWAVSFTPRPLCSKRTWYSLDRRLGEPQSRSGRCWLEEHLLPLPVIGPRSSSLQPVAILTELIRLLRNYYTCVGPVTYLDYLVHVPRWKLQIYMTILSEAKDVRVSWLTWILPQSNSLNIYWNETFSSISCRKTKHFLWPP
jgi:hypothetical protein